MKRAILVLLVVLLVSVFFATPYYTLYQINQSAKIEQFSKLDKLIDYSLVKNNLKNEALRTILNQEQKRRENERLELLIEREQQVIENDKIYRQANANADKLREQFNKHELAQMEAKFLAIKNELKLAKEWKHDMNDYLIRANGNSDLIPEMIKQRNIQERDKISKLTAEYKSAANAYYSMSNIKNDLINAELAEQIAQTNYYAAKELYDKPIQIEEPTVLNIFQDVITSAALNAVVNAKVNAVEISRIITEDNSDFSCKKWKLNYISINEFAAKCSNIQLILSRDWFTWKLTEIRGIPLNI